METLAGKKKANPRTPCTVLLPVRNGEEFISKSLENLFQITGEQDQILVINDGSTDSTTSIVKQYREKYCRLDVITIPPSGLVIALNTGLENALNEFVARADVDDLYRQDRIDLQVEFLQANPDVGAVFSDYRFWNSGNDNLGLLPSGAIPSATKLSLVDAIRTPHPSVMFRKSAILKSGGYLASDFPAEDLGLWLRLIQAYEIASIPQPLLWYRINPSGITASRQSGMINKKNELLASLDYRGLIKGNINKYAEVKLAYKPLSKRFERLALHNIDLLICIYRAKLDHIEALHYVVKVFVRFFNPRVILAIAIMLRERKLRKG